MQSAESGVEDATIDLAYLDIRSPISGIVASGSTQQGETVAASFATPTFVTVIQKNALEIVAMVDEADIGDVRPGEGVTFTTETWPHVAFIGTVLHITPMATIISGVVNYEVAISIQKNAEMLKPDMTANVNIVTAEHPALLDPSSCVHKDPAGSFVYVLAPSGLRDRRGVATATRTNGEVRSCEGWTRRLPCCGRMKERGRHDRGL